MKQKHPTPLRLAFTGMIAAFVTIGVSIASLSLGATLISYEDDFYHDDPSGLEEDWGHYDDWEEEKDWEEDEWHEDDWDDHDEWDEEDHWEDEEWEEVKDEHDEWKEDEWHSAAGEHLDEEVDEAIAVLAEAIEVTEDEDVELPHELREDVYYVLEWLEHARNGSQEHLEHAPHKVGRAHELAHKLFEKVRWYKEHEHDEWEEKKEWHKEKWEDEEWEDKEHWDKKKEWKEHDEWKPKHAAGPEDEHLDDDIDHAIEELDRALEETEEMGVELPGELEEDVHYVLDWLEQARDGSEEHRMHARHKIGRAMDLAHKLRMKIGHKFDAAGMKMDKPRHIDGENHRPPVQMHHDKSMQPRLAEMIAKISEHLRNMPIPNEEVQESIDEALAWLGELDAEFSDPEGPQPTHEDMEEVIHAMEELKHEIHDAMREMKEEHREERKEHRFEDAEQRIGNVLEEMSDIFAEVDSFLSALDAEGIVLSDLALSTYNAATDAYSIAKTSCGTDIESSSDIKQCKIAIKAVFGHFRTMEEVVMAQAEEDEALMSIIEGHFEGDEEHPDEDEYEERDYEPLDEEGDDYTG